MILVWIAEALLFYTINFQMKYLPGDIFTNTIAASVVEIIGKLFASWVLIKIGLKPLLTISFIFSIIGAFGLIFVSTLDSNPNQAFYNLIFLLVTRFGTAFTIVGAYMGCVVTFPTSVVGSAMGLCNFFARMFAIMVPFIAELKEPYPMVVLVTYAFICLLSSQGLITNAIYK